MRLAYAYDRTDKLTSIKGYAADDPGNTRPLEATHYWYDGRGLLIRASNQAALVEFERDGNGRIVSESVNGRKVDKQARRARQSHRAPHRPRRGRRGARAHHARPARPGRLDHHRRPRAARFYPRRARPRDPPRVPQRLSPRPELGLRWPGDDPERRPRFLWPSRGLTAVRAPTASGTAAERHYAWDKAGAPVGIDDLIWGKTRYAYDANGQIAEASFRRRVHGKIQLRRGKERRRRQARRPRDRPGSRRPARLAVDAGRGCSARTRPQRRDDRADPRRLRPCRLPPRRSQRVSPEDVALRLGRPRPASCDATIPRATPGSIATTRLADASPRCVSS